MVVFCDENAESLSHMTEVFSFAHAYEPQSAEWRLYSGAYKSLARSGRKQATTTEDFDIHISHLSS